MVKNSKDDDVKYMLENIEFIITPMTNAVGFYYGEREERISSEIANRIGRRSFDINRDFPYN